MDKRMVYIVISFIGTILILLLNIGFIVWFCVAEPEMTKELYYGMLFSRLTLALCLFVTVLCQLIDTHLDIKEEERNEKENADDNTN